MPDSETGDASTKGAPLTLAHLDLCIPRIAHHENEATAGIGDRKSVV